MPFSIYLLVDLLNYNLRNYILQAIVAVATNRGGLSQKELSEIIGSSKIANSPWFRISLKIKCRNRLIKFNHGFNRNL